MRNTGLSIPPAVLGVLTAQIAGYIDPTADTQALSPLQGLLLKLILRYGAVERRE
jgi:hypothetical protein